MKKLFISSLALMFAAITAWSVADSTNSPKLSNTEEVLVDVTSKIVNPQFDNGSTGWTSNNSKSIEVKKGNSSTNYVVTAYNYQVNVSQTISGLEQGNYILKVQACSRYKDKAAGIQDYEAKVKAGTAIPNEAYIYANGLQQKIKNIFEETSTYDFYNNCEKKSQISAKDITMSNGEQIPYDSSNFSYAFGTLGMYENQLEFTVGSDGVATIGIKNELSGSSYKPYIAYDNFRLYRVDNAGGDPADPTDPVTPDPEPGTGDDTSDEDYNQPVELYDLHAPAGQFVAICMPYAVKSEYFGQVYTIGSITDGKALIVPVSEVATGVPCVVKSKGSSSITSASTNYNTKPTVFSLWDNTSMTVNGNFTDFSWNATDIYNNVVNSANLTFVEGDLSNLDFTCSIENNAVARFWAQNPVYLTETTSTVGNYLNLTVYNSSSRRDKPNPVLVPVYTSSSSQTLSYWQKPDKSDKQTVTVAANAKVAEIYELIPSATYNYECGQAKGKFTVSGTIRMMSIGTNVANMRDLGGKQGYGGKYVRYGKIYRSAEFKGSTYNINDTEKAKLVELGIGAEIDLRNTDGGTSRSWIPNLVDNDNYFYAKNSSIIANGPARLFETSTINMIKKEWDFLIANLKKDRSVQFHCRIGADRTGLFAFLLQGILGVSESDILREYELTSFSSAGLRTKAQGDSDGGNYQTELPKLKTKTGATTFSDIFVNYFQNTLKVTQTDIDYFRSVMLGDSPLPADLETVELAKAKQELNENIAVAEKFNNYTIGTEYGQYACSDEDAFDAAKAEVVEARKVADNSGAKLYEIRDENAVLEEDIEAALVALSLNMPQKGDQFFIRMANGQFIAPSIYDTSANLIGPRKAASDVVTWSMANDQKDYCIFKYDGKNIIQVKDDYVFAPTLTSANYITAVPSTSAGVTPAVFTESGAETPGAYNLKVGNYVIAPGSGKVSATSGQPTTSSDLMLVKYTPTPTSIETITVEQETGVTYNLLGIPVGDDYKGFVIRDGKKYLRR